MLDLVINNAKSLKAENICVVISPEMEGFKEEIIKNHKEIKIEFAIQKDRLGTAHGVKTALENMTKIHQNVIILYGDTPLIQTSTLENMIESLKENSLCILGFDCFSENKYGRLVTKGNELEKIVEFKDANNDQREITLCNSGVIAINHNNILSAIDKIDNDNAAKEYYLTDIVEVIKKEALKATYIKTLEKEVLGVNSRIELAKAEKIKQDELRKSFMENGVTLIDPETVYFSADTKIENDVIIHPNVVIGKNVEIKNGVQVKSFSHIEGAIIKNNAIIGPFARIRPGSEIGQNSKIGNFVEIKKSKIEKEAKISHLSYIGDSEIGQNANIGAGTITCNYDGYNKFKTVIGQNAFIGSNTSLIAPVNIGKNSLIGAGSVITKDVDETDLAVSRSKQTNIKEGAKKHHEKNSKN